MSEPTASTSPTQKKRKVIHAGGAGGRKAPTGPVSDGPAGMQSLSAEIFLKLFACLDWRQLVTLRLVCKLWKETTRSTSPSIGVGQHGHLSCLYWLFPRASCLAIASASDAGEEFVDERIMVERLTPICSFRHLTKLVLTRVVQKRQRNGDILKYCDHIFQVPTLEEIVFEDCEHLSWDLSMVAGTPRLRKLTVDHSLNDDITGNLSSLSVLKNTLMHLRLSGCHNVEGSFSDLRDFPRLEYLDLDGATDIETHEIEVQPGSFPSLAHLDASTYAYVSTDLDQRSVQFAFDRIASIKITESIALGLFRFAPNLREIDCSRARGNRGSVKGDLSDLHFLRGSLCHLNLRNNRKVTGSIGDLRDFPLLQHLNLHNCRNISPASPCLCPSDFKSLKYLNGDIPFEFVSDVAPLMELLFSRGTTKHVVVTLSKESPDFIDSYDTGFGVNFVQVGPRKGWEWFCISNPEIYYFETNWLNNEPRPGDIGYEKYHQVVERRKLRNPGPFAGRYTPPKTRGEYEEIMREFDDRCSIVNT